MDVYLTRDTLGRYVYVWPATVGIRKFHGCVVYGAAWNKDGCTRGLYLRGNEYAEYLLPSDCLRRFGFFPEEGEAWLIEGKKRTQIYLAFSP